MSAKAALQAQLDALMGKERDVPVELVRVRAPRCLRPVFPAPTRAETRSCSMTLCSG